MKRVCSCLCVEFFIGDFFLFVGMLIEYKMPHFFVGWFLHNLGISPKFIRQKFHVGNFSGAYVCVRQLNNYYYILYLCFYTISLVTYANFTLPSSSAVANMLRWALLVCWINSPACHLPRCAECENMG